MDFFLQKSFSYVVTEGWKEKQGTKQYTNKTKREYKDTYI